MCNKNDDKYNSDFIDDRRKSKIQKSSSKNKILRRSSSKNKKLRRSKRLMFKNKNVSVGSNQSRSIERLSLNEKMDEIFNMLANLDKKQDKIMKLLSSKLKTRGQETDETETEDSEIEETDTDESGSSESDRE
jgi:hypothetical protein